jgi:hypothetical protein
MNLVRLRSRMPLACSHWALPSIPSAGQTSCSTNAGSLYDSDPDKRSFLDLTASTLATGMGLRTLGGPEKPERERKEPAARATFCENPTWICSTHQLLSPSETLRGGHSTKLFENARYLQAEGKRGTDGIRGEKVG